MRGSRFLKIQAAVTSLASLGRVYCLASLDGAHTRHFVRCTGDWSIWVENTDEIGRRGRLNFYKVSHPVHLKNGQFASSLSDALKIINDIEAVKQ